MTRDELRGQYGYSTMGYPISAHDMTQITKRWNALRAACRELPDAMISQVEMLNAISELIGLAHAARSAISEGWYQADKAGTKVLQIRPRLRPDDALVDSIIQQILKGE